MSNHTPGPWVVQEPDPENKGGGLLVKPVPGQVVAEVDPGPEMVGNAHLIAAAPELLVTLQNCVNVLALALPLFDDESTDNKDSRDEVESVIDAARDAIAKAEGRK